MNKNMKIIGLTGGLASGKSTVSAYLRQKGIPVIDCDIEARKIFDVGEKAYYDVIDAFGTEILNADNTVNRKLLASVVFPDAEKVKKLNSISHPAIMERTDALLKEYENSGYAVAVIDAPLLIESGMNSKTDEVWLVYTDYDVQIKRAMERDKSTREQAESRIKNQLPTEEKMKSADRLINNNGTISELYNQVDKFLTLIVDEKDKI